MLNNNHPENHPNGYTSRELAFADVRILIASLCSQPRSPAYKAAVMEALGAIDALAQPSPKAIVEQAAVSDEDLWVAAVAELGTSKAPPYGFPVLVLPRPRDVAALFRALTLRFGLPVAAPEKKLSYIDGTIPHC